MIRQVDRVYSTGPKRWRVMLECGHTVVHTSTVIQVSPPTSVECPACNAGVEADPLE